MKRFWIALLAGILAPAQEPVTAGPGGTERSREAGGYSVSNSMEVGYRLAQPAGDLGIYRASVNYGNGVRLLDGRLRIHSLDGKGRLVDEFSIRSSGAATDPYQAHSFRVRKNGLYRYDGIYRRVRYHNRLASLWQGEHGLRTERALQSHDFVLRPGAAVEGLVGFDSNRRSGPGFSSVGVGESFDGFDARNILRYRRHLRQHGRQLRFGTTARFLGMSLTAIQAVDRFEEAGAAFDASGAPSAATNIQPLEEFNRDEPLSRDTLVTTVALRTRRERRVGFTANFVYADGTGDSQLSEVVSAPDPAASVATLRETRVVGGAHRRQSSGDLAVTVLPAPRWALTNATAFHNTRIDGQAAFFELGLFTSEYLRFEHLGVRRLSNATEVIFRPVKDVSLYGAHRFSKRRARTAEGLEYPDFSFGMDLGGTDNDVHSGAGGVRWAPGSGLRASFDFEVGRADLPLTPTSERRFHNESLRVRWRREGFSIYGYVRNRTNDNPTELLAYSSRSLARGVHGSWTAPASGLVVDGGYSLLEIDSSAGILDLFGPRSGGSRRARTVFGSRIHHLSFAVRAVPAERIEVHAGLSLTRDAGAAGFDARDAGSTRFTRNGAVILSSLPNSYRSPRVRVSVALHERLTWNVGWQHYSYAERLAGVEGFRAHVGFASLTFRF